MGLYYLDIETTGLDQKKDKIITIQYQELDESTGEPLEPLVILKEWEKGGESRMLKDLVADTHITSKHPFDFIPVGNNLRFEHDFLSSRCKRHALHSIDVMKRPQIDLKAILVLMNYGGFKGSGLDKMTGKKESGKKVGEWYQAQRYDRILKYVQDEAESFSEFFVWLYKEMPALHKKFLAEIGK